jgi:hypothetical protein
MREDRGDLWRIPAHVRCITTNGTVRRDGHAVMGRGCARQARDDFPELAETLGRLLTRNGNHVQRLMAEMPLPGRPPGLIRTGFWELVSFPVKHHWRDRADLDLIERSCGELMDLADANPEWGVILLPRPGCGNGQLEWSEVRPRIAPLLDDRVVVIAR